jgi:hypothetical protein
LDAIRPWSDLEAPRLSEVEQYRPGVVQQSEEPHRPVCGDQVEIGHAASQQGVSLIELVPKIETGHPAGESLAR